MNFNLLIDAIGDITPPSNTTPDLDSNLLLILGICAIVTLFVIFIGIGAIVNHFRNKNNFTNLTEEEKELIRKHRKQSNSNDNSPFQ